MIISNTVGKSRPSFGIEDSFCGSVIGFDEVGRGALSGPVVAAAVLYPDTDLASILVINAKLYYQTLARADDSKKLSYKKRSIIAEELKSSVIYGIGEASNNEIDEINILNATFLAMKRAFYMLEKKLSLFIDDLGKIYPKITFLVDGNIVPKWNDYNVKAILPVVGGDNKSYTIASASVIAKAYRDDIMTQLDRLTNLYKWSKNKGYGTAEHLQAIREFGYSNYHRKSFYLKNLDL